MDIICYLLKIVLLLVGAFFGGAFLTTLLSGFLYWLIGLEFTDPNYNSITESNSNDIEELKNRGVDITAHYIRRRLNYFSKIIGFSVAGGISIYLLLIYW